MNGRSGLFTFFLFLFLLVMILLQVLSMVQADRLYERLNLLIDRWETTGAVKVASEKVSSSDLPGEEYPGDEGDWLVYHLRGEPRTLNPISVEGSLEGRMVYLRNIFETLFYYDLSYYENESKSTLVSLSLDFSFGIEYFLTDNISISGQYNLGGHYKFGEEKVVSTIVEDTRDISNIDIGISSSSFIISIYL